MIISFRAGNNQKLRWLTPVLLLLVITQGILGGLRVRFQSEVLALGMVGVGPLFFACCAWAVVLTSRGWLEVKPLAASGSLSRAALAGSVLAYGQLILGAFLRHPADDGSPRLFQMVLMFHIFLGVTLLGHIVALGWQVHRKGATENWLKRPAQLLLVLGATQVLLGFATLIVKYGWPTGWVDKQFLSLLQYRRKTYGRQ